MNAPQMPVATPLVWLRSLLYFALMLPTLVVIFVLMLLAWPFPYRLRAWLGRQWARVQMGLLRLVCGLDYEVSGGEHIPPQAYVAMVKHQSAWETIVSNILFRQAAWVFKRELLYLPFFGWGLALTRPIAVDRGTPRAALDQVVRKGGELLAAGRTVVIFPEGTRMRPGEQGKYGHGGSLLAVKTGAPVVPVAHNAGLYWPRKSLLKFPGTIKVVIGPVITTRDRDVREVTRLVEEWIEGTMPSLYRPCPSPGLPSSPC